MSWFIIRRMLQSVMVLLFVTIAVFFIMHAMPGDPILTCLGDEATEESVRHYTELFGFNQPLYIQYQRWLTGFFHGETGRSVVYAKDVIHILPARIAVTLTIALPAFVLSVISGVLPGVLAAFKRGKLLDSVISAIANIGLCIGVAMIPSYAKLTRSRVLQLRESDFVTAGIISGQSKMKNTLKHILPNCLPVSIVRMTMNLGAAIMAEAGLCYPGAGITPPTPYCGYLVNYGREWLSAKPYMCILPGLLIIAATWALNVCGHALRDALDPKFRGRL